MKPNLRFVRPLATVIALALAAATSPAAAVQTDFGGSDFKVRFDNTVRSLVGVRTTSPDSILGANPAFSASEYSFDKGDLNAARLDLLSELDATYKQIAGAHVSFAGWYDLAYSKYKVTISPDLASQNVPSGYAANDNQLGKYALDRYRGPGGEFLDAYAYARLKAGPVPLSLKAGRFANYWSEATTLGGAMHGNAYSQIPLDLAKAFANPGADKRELFRPLGRIAADAKVLPSVTLSAEYLLEWQSYIYPEGATFAGPADFAFYGPDGQFARLGGRPIYIKNGGSNDSRQHDWGVALRSNPEFLHGTFGMYYRRYSDKIASVLVVPNPGGQGPLSPTLNSPLQYQQFYAEGIDLIGLSYSRKVFFGNTAIEANYRHNTPLVAQALGFATAPAPALAPLLFPHGTPQLIGNSYQARGDTFHVVANARGMLPATAAWSAAAWNVEGTYDRVVTVRENEDMFFAVGHGVCSGSPQLAAAGLAKTKNDGCATDNAAGMAAGFAPTWKQVWDGVDLSLPLNGSLFFWGNSPVSLGGNAGSGTYSAGVGADIKKKLPVRLDLKYTGFYGNTIDNGKVMTSNNGLLSLLKNRESVVFMAKTTF
ncbi:MAG: DUF1302 domain-containing protein [Myxococcales bacterium]